jgi:hypothetical protein
MSEESYMPDWADKLCDAIAATIEFNGVADIEAFFWAPDETSWGTNLLEVAPAVMEIVEAGPNDGEHVFGIVHNFDLLALKENFEEVDALTFGFENDGQPTVTLEGKFEGNEVVVLIYFRPFQDEIADDTGEEDEADEADDEAENRGDEA